MRRDPTYIIYLITCLTNGKVYVGRTTQSLRVRWKSHLNSARYAKYQHLKLYRAMVKYGIAQFKIEVIDTAASFEELKQKEADHIMARKSHLDEHGYNMSTDTDKGLALLDPRSIDQRRRSIHHHHASRRVAKHGIGVRRTGRRYFANMSYDRQQYNLGFTTRDEAAVAYDHLATHFYGRQAVLNHPDRVYDPTEVAATVKRATEVTQRQFGSRFRGVSRSSRGFSATIHKDKRQYWLGSFDNETEAALTVDKARTHLFGPNHPKLNLPERATEYADGTALATWFESTTVKRTHGVSYDRRIDLYTAFVRLMGHTDYLGSFPDPRSAAERRDRAVVYHELDQPLNYPDQLEVYRADCKQVIESIRRTKAYGRRAKS